jgi:CubicO group peptidase (beta-lactamase class C family)
VSARRPERTLPGVPAPLDATELLQAARRDVDRGRVPACSLALFRHGEPLLVEALGDADPDTRFHVYSATKPLVSSAVWVLIGEGVLDVSRPVADYVPEFGANGKEAVTVEQVMLHTCGFPSAPMAPAEGADPERRVRRLAEWHLEWEPGSRFVYHAGSAHWVLAELLSRLGGGDFRDVIEQRVCRPLGLPRVLGLDPADDAPIAPPTPVGEKGVTREDEVLLSALASPEGRAAGVPGGGAVMTAADLARFYSALLADPVGVWKPEVLADATGTIRCTLPDPLLGAPVNRTIGLVVAGDDGKHTMRYACFGAGVSPRAFGHAGAHGQVAWADPATGLAFVYLQNGVDRDMFHEGGRAVIIASKAAELVA